MEIDARGLECPIPTLRAVEAIKRARARGDVNELVVRTDDAICAADIPHLAQALGYTARRERADANEWMITLQPASPGPIA